MIQPAPLNLEIAEAPRHGSAFWIHSQDGIRLRVGIWKNKSPRLGTIMVFPGRTEYIEKYGRMITFLDGLGFSVFVVDWRGQGLSARTTEDPRTGHVQRFSDYQNDVAAMVAAAEELELPKPWNLIGHSMGACIGLRALTEGLAVDSSAFTGPMWNINLPALRRAAAWPASWAAQALGKGHVYAPGTDGQSYVLSTDFSDNRLTHDIEMYRYFVKQASNLTDCQIGGPSMGWLFQTLKETRSLTQVRSPDVPCIAFCGEQDLVVDPAAVRRRMAKWPDGKLEIVEGAKHDIFSEVPHIRERVLHEICEFFSNDQNVTNDRKAVMDTQYAQPVA